MVLFYKSNNVVLRVGGFTYGKGTHFSSAFPHQKFSVTGEHPSESRTMRTKNPANNSFRKFVIKET